MSSVYKTVLAIAICLFLAVNLLTLKDGHNWGGDFGQYLKHAQNLLSGRNYDHGIYFVPQGDPSLDLRAGGFSPDKYPPGLPLLLSPLIAVWGIDLAALKSLNVIFWALWALIMAGMIRRRLGEPMALLALLFLLSSPWVFTFKQSITSDIPFLFFAFLAVAVYETRVEPKDAPPKRRLWGLVFFGLAAGFAVWIRTAGLALFVAAFIHLAVFKRDWRSLALTAAAALVTLVGQRLLIGPSVGYADQLLFAGSGNLVSQTLTTLLFAVYSLLRFFIPSPQLASYFIVRLVFGLVVLWVGVYFIWSRLAARSLSMADLFFVVYTGVIVLWPWATVTRFYLPTMGLGLILFLESFKGVKPVESLGKRAASVLGGMMALALAGNLVATASYWNYDDDAVMQPASQELFNWVKANVAADEHYIFFKPRVLAFFSGRTGAVYDRKASLTPQLERFRKAGIRWLILRRREAEAVASNPNYVEKWSNRRFVIFYAPPERSSLERPSGPAGGAGSGVGRRSPSTMATSG